jgi:branched-chain amino acid transport system substrate-binding protein
MFFTVTRRAAAALVLATLLAGTPLISRAADPYEISAILPLTGSVALLGNSIAEALVVLAASVNKEGGIGGRQLKFVVADDQSNPATTVQLVNGIIASKAAVFIGPALNATCSAAAPLLRDGPVSMCTSPGIHPDAGSFSFSASPSTADLAIVTAHYAKRRGWKKIAFLITTDASGIDGEKVLQSAFNAPDAQGTQIVDIEHYAVNDLTVAAQLSRIKAAAPDALYVWASGTPSTTAMRGIHDLGLDIPIMTSYSNATYSQLAAFKDYMPKELLIPGLPAMVPPDQLSRGSLRDAVAAYDRILLAAKIRPDVLQATAWDEAELLVSALRHVGPSATAEQVRAYLANLSGFAGVTGTFDFRAIPQRGVDWRTAVLITRWDPAKNTFVSASPIGG